MSGPCRSVRPPVNPVNHYLPQSAGSAGFQELVVHPQASAALEYLLEVLDEVESFSDPQKWLHPATAGGDMGIRLIVVGQKQILEQTIGRSLSEEQVTLLCKSCGAFFAQGVAFGELDQLMVWSLFGISHKRNAWQTSLGQGTCFRRLWKILGCRSC